MTLLRLAPLHDRDVPDPAIGPAEPDPPVRLTTAPRPTPEQLRLFTHLPAEVPDPPGPTRIRRRNPRLQGEIGLSDAIGFFGRRGFTVSVPLADNQAYDLLVEREGLVCRVQVKTATSRTRGGVFQVNLETAGGNRTRTRRRPFAADAVDLLYVLTDEGSRWVVPATDIHATRSLNLGARAARWRGGPDAGLPPVPS